MFPALHKSKYSKPVYGTPEMPRPNLENIVQQLEESLQKPEILEFDRLAPLIMRRIEDKVSAYRIKISVTRCTSQSIILQVGNKTKRHLRRPSTTV